MIGHEVNPGLDAISCQVLQQRVTAAVCNADSAEERKCRFDLSCDRGHAGHVGEAVEVALEQFALSCPRLVERVELRHPNCSVDVGQMRPKTRRRCLVVPRACLVTTRPRVAADAEVPPQPHPACQLVVVRRNRTAFAAGDVLDGIEAEACEVTD